MVGGAPSVPKLADDIYGLIFKNVTIEESNDEGLGDYSVYVSIFGKSGIKEITFDEDTTVQGNVMISAFKDTQVSNAGMMEKMLQVDALDGATVNNENTGTVVGEFRGSAQGEGSKMTLTNQGTVKDALDGFSAGKGATTTIKNEGDVGKLLANALVGGKTEAKNDGYVDRQYERLVKGRRLIAHPYQHRKRRVRHDERGELPQGSGHRDQQRLDRGRHGRLRRGWPREAQ